MEQPPKTPSRLAPARRRASVVKIGAVVAASAAFVATALAAREAHPGSTEAGKTEEAIAPPRWPADERAQAERTPFSESSLGKLAEPGLRRLAATGIGQIAAAAERRASDSGVSEVAVPLVALAVSLLAPGVIGEGDDGEPKARSSSS